VQRVSCVALCAVLLSMTGSGPVAAAERSEPAGALQGLLEAFGRPREQSADPVYRFDVAAEIFRLRALFADEDASEFAGRPRATLTRWVTGPNVGDPWRNETLWHGGVHQRIHFLNAWGAKLTGDLWGPPDLFDSDTPRPAVVVTDGSIQGNARMYWWAAQTLAENGYVVLTYDVQGQGESETFGHRADGSFWCGAVEQPADTPPLLLESGPCPDVPFQQSANFMGGAVWAHNFLLSTPGQPWEYHRDGTGTESHNPWWDRIDRTRVGAAGHSFGAAAVSFAQGNPQLLREPIRAIVAWDRLSACQARIRPGPGQDCPPDGVLPADAPALDLQADDFFFPTIPAEVPDPAGKLAAFDRWRAAGTDVMVIAQRSSTHLEYTSAPVLPASQYGQDVARYYTLAWFDRYLRGDPAAEERLLARDLTLTHFGPRGQISEVELAPEQWMSSRYHSAVAIGATCSADWVAATPC